MSRSDPTPDRCREVLDALSRPPGRLDVDFQTQHLAECGRCAEAAQAAQRLALAWDAGRPSTPPGGFDNLWSRVMARVEAGEAAAVEPEPAVLPMVRRDRWKAKVVAIVLAQAAAVLVGWMAFHHRGAVTDIPSRPAPVGMLALLGDLPKVIDIEPSEVTILRVDREATIDRRDIDSLEISDTETVGFDTTVLGYFEGLGGS